MPARVQLAPLQIDRVRRPLCFDLISEPRGRRAQMTASRPVRLTYRADVAARELRRELGKLQSGFDMPEEIRRPEKFKCSVKDLKDTLRVLGVTEQDIQGCMEKSHLEDLLQSNCVVFLESVNGLQEDAC